MSSCLKSIGDLYADNHQITEAAKNYEQADSIDKFTFLSTLLHLSDFYYQHEEFEKAEHYQERAYQDVIQSKCEQEKLLRSKDKEQSITIVGKAHQKSEIIYQLTGVNSFGEKIYLFIKLPYKLYLSLQTMIVRGFSFDPRHYGEIVAAGKGEPDTRIMSAMIFVHNVAKNAIADMRALKLNPNNGEDLRSRGYAHLLEKNYTAARFDFLHAIQLEPENAYGYDYYGQLLYDLERYQESWEYYDQAIQLDSQLASSYLGRGKSLFELQQYSEAKTDFEHAISLKPEEPWYHNWLGRSLTHIREWKAALNAYNCAIRLLPWEGFFLRMRSITHEEMMNYTKARSDLDIAIELSPEDAWNYEALAHLELVQSNYKSALHPIQKAIELNSEYANFYFWRGLAYLGTDQEEYAIQSIKRSIGHSADYLNIIYTKFWLGVVDNTLQSKPQIGEDNWVEVRVAISNMQDEAQKLRAEALMELFLRGSKTYELFEGVLSVKQGSLTTPLIYLRLLAHLFPDRNDIQETTRWFEGQIVERYCDGA